MQLRPDETTLGESKDRKRSKVQALRPSNYRNCRKEAKPAKERRHCRGGRKEATTEPSGNTISGDHQETDRS